MSRVVSSRAVPAGEIVPILQPRDDVVLEREGGDGVFVAAHGPFRRYERRVEVSPAAGGLLQVTETIDFKLALPFWSFLFVRPMGRALRDRRAAAQRQPWWAPPERLDERAATVLSLICLLALVGGYLTTLLTQTITYASDEFDTSKTAQGVTLASVRGGVLLALVLAAFADRKGRRRMLLLSAAAACVASVTGALAPNLVWLGATQMVARGFASAMVVLLAVVSAEEMPAGSRAFAYGLISMASALGVGVSLFLLPLADLGTRGWRLLFLVPLLWLPVVAYVRRHLPETRRYETAPRGASMAGHGRRFWLLASSGFLLAAFAAPSLQFQNEFLRDERGFGAATISLFIIVTGVPGSIGVIGGGHAADVRGRRMVGAIAISIGTILTVAMFTASGATMWIVSAAGSIVGAAVVPSLGVYRPELFPTALRGRTAGIIETITLAGSAAGLVIVGQLADRWGAFARPLAIVAIGPLIVAVLVITLFPETAHRSLEELNPEDAPATSLDAPLAATSQSSRPGTHPPA